MQNQKFIDWAKNLDVDELPRYIRTNTKCIDRVHIEEIDKEFNHFYQKFIGERDVFLAILFNQSIPQVEREKEKFEEFAHNLDKRDIRDKIIFLYFIAKRSRNKFFHGIKSIVDVCKDKKEFDKISRYLKLS